ncbi:mitotic checkpoint regulator, MAD2B-interacting-domain-containing protein [Phaeosphaeriaceae sp. PMI808]|nr:mitotic checkpoint regulator, MAD2B-interacting-domain-containing protein [Phaeosphaeriaceae sp. PMI808]
MNLIAYSDSESDGESVPVPKPALKQAPKPSFQKVVDRSNPGRIKVNLPGASQSRANKDDMESDAPPAKKPRLGGAAAFGGFNAMLPAPKKAVVGATTTGSATSGKRGLGKGLGAGNKEEAILEISATTPQVETQTVAKPAAPRFVPMSVGKGKKKKPVALRSGVASLENTKPSATVAISQPAAPPPHARKPKVSLFGVSSETPVTVSNSSNEDYQPILYKSENEPNADDAYDEQSAHPRTQFPPATGSTATSNDLVNIASDLNLSEAERRQLFGKRGQGVAGLSSARIVEYNTDTEYAHNETLRQQGEQIQHNPLKSISGTGKNSLRSLVNVATTQKDALEDHFATGYRNKKEAGNKYGW